MNYNSKILSTVSVVAIVAILSYSCKKDPVDPGPPPAPSPYSKMTIEFSHTVNGVQIIRDSMMFTNLSGNSYSIYNMEYLISNVRIDDYDGNFKLINQYQLVNLWDDQTWKMVVKDSILKGSYKSVSFFMGFLDEKNVNNGDYPQLDEEFWAFPPIIDGLPAGGYYAFKMDGKFIPAGDSVAEPYNMYIGSKALEVNGSNKSYVPNPIIGSLAKSHFELNSSSVRVQFRFNVAKVFNYNDGNLLNLEMYNTDFEKSVKGTEIVSKNLKNVFTMGDVVYGIIEK